MTKPPSYTAQGKLLLKLDATPSLTGIQSPRENISTFTPLTSEGNPLKTETEILLSTPLIQETIRQLNLKDEQGNARAETEIQKQLQIINVPGADVLQVSYTGKNPQESAEIVNHLMSIYINNNIDNNRSQAIAARKFISAQLPIADVAVERAEAELRKFKELNQIVDLNQEATSTVEIIKNIEQQITQTQAELAEANNYYQVFQKQIQSQLGMSVQDALARSALSQSAGVQDILKKYQQVQSELAIQATRLSDNHPSIINLKRQETALKELLKTRVEAVVKQQNVVAQENFQFEEPQQNLLEELVKAQAKSLSLSSRLAALENAKTNYQQRATNLPKLDKEQRQLQRKLEVAQSTYQTLLQKLQEVQVTQNQNIGNARIIEAAAIPRSPSDSTKKLVILGGGGIAGILLAIFTIFILELVDKSSTKVKETQDIFGCTLLGVIPYFGNLSKYNSQLQNVEQAATRIDVQDNEFYKNIQTNLKFRSLEQSLKVIVIASAVHNEGKSTVAANLAAAMAKAGSRVLLVDADMRFPSLHTAWDLTNEIGLSNAIVGQYGYKVAVKAITPNLDVLCSGVVPPNPLALLNSAQMAALISEFSSNYKFVIIDTPSIIYTADALVLSEMADGVVLVTRPGVIDVDSAYRAKEALHNSRLNLLGLIINGVVQKNEHKNSIHYLDRYTLKDSQDRQSNISLN
ncbi:GumC family protein [Aliterella atlantica]|uniref:GumC family protein n=1 Tax=Aliterella atlantica TaxID=1827278 RepID=UPI001364A672|nr:polysaccharide biosynthesis tyrosine autokinase [Aliterella atlantica]